jgi:hypothetical protein
MIKLVMNFFFPLAISQMSEIRKVDWTSKEFILFFFYVEGDENAPSLCWGRFRGHLAFDTGPVTKQPCSTN